MKIEVETPERGEPWSVQAKDGYLVIVVDESLTNVQYINRSGVVIEKRT